MALTEDRPVFSADFPYSYWTSMSPSQSQLQLQQNAKKKTIKKPIVIDSLWKYNKITYAKPYTQNRSYSLLIKRIFFKYPQGLGLELGYLSPGSPCYKPQALLERKHSVSL